MNRHAILPYHKGALDVDMLRWKLLGGFEPNRLKPLDDVNGALQGSLFRPADSPPLRQPGARVVLAATCSEGSDSATFEQRMEAAYTPDDVIERIPRYFEMGGRKAYQVAREVKHARVYLYSKLRPGKARCWFMHPLSDWSELAALVNQVERISVLPQAARTLTEVVSA